MNSQDKKENPANWSASKLEEEWTSYVESEAESLKSNLPIKRLRYQAEISSNYPNTIEKWPEMSDSERKQAWKSLCNSLESSSKEMLPVCVQCGICCQKGSPTLMEDDLEILKEEHIPWSQLYTLRKGEPAHSPITDEVFYLEEEYIKLREKPGTKTCVFFDDESNECKVHLNRLTQCRAQECWDDEPVKQLAGEPKLTRKKLFGSVEVLLEMIEEHDRRCSFEEMRDLFDGLKNSGGKTASKVVEFLAFEEHFRSFVAEKLNIPEDTLDLVFGRPLASMVRLFGFKVEVDEDGAKVLKPDQKG